MDPLAKLFGSTARVKLLRLFLLNEGEFFTAAGVATRAKLSKVAARKEVAALQNAGLLKKKAGKGGALYTSNLKFPHYDALKSFFRTASGISDTSIGSNLRKAGALRLVTLSGLFTGVPESKVDILVVGDRLDERALGTVVHGLEAELGREIRYAAFSTEDFRYRIGVYDRLVRDIFDYPHRTILDRIGI